MTEKLTVKNMTLATKTKPDPDQPGQFLPNGAAAQAGLKREILATAPATFLNLPARKAEEPAGPYVEVPTRNVKPSPSCSGCGHQRTQALCERLHHCPHCQGKLTRDRNAACGMLNWVLFGTVCDPHSGLERAEVYSASGDAPVQEFPPLAAGLGEEVRKILPLQPIPIIWQYLVPLYPAGLDRQLDDLISWEARGSAIPPASKWPLSQIFRITGHSKKFHLCEAPGAPPVPNPGW
ncbi:MAG: transposase [Blastocatellia bacterium]|nr:transposase [Blastocatellia bacterium]